MLQSHKKMQTASEVPGPACSPVTVPFRLVVEDAWEAHSNKQPALRFAKRMRLGQNPPSLGRFVAVKQSGTPSLSAAAVTRRQEFVADPHVCEPCNTTKRVDMRQAIAVCPRCGEVETYNVPDTSYREGTSMHTPYLYKRR